MKVFLATLIDPSDRSDFLFVYHANEPTLREKKFTLHVSRVIDYK